MDRASRCITWKVSTVTVFRAVDDTSFFLWSLAILYEILISLWFTPLDYDLSPWLYLFPSFTVLSFLKSEDLDCLIFSYPNLYMFCHITFIWFLPSSDKHSHMAVLHQISYHFIPYIDIHSHMAVLLDASWQPWSNHIKGLSPLCCTIAYTWNTSVCDISLLFLWHCANSSVIGNNLSSSRVLTPLEADSLCVVLC